MSKLQAWFLVSAFVGVLNSELYAGGGHDNKSDPPSTSVSAGVTGIGYHAHGDGILGGSATVVGSANSQASGKNPSVNVTTEGTALGFSGTGTNDLVSISVGSVSSEASNSGRKGENTVLGYAHQENHMDLSERSMTLSDGSIVYGFGHNSSQGEYFGSSSRMISGNAGAGGLLEVSAINNTVHAHNAAGSRAEIEPGGGENLARASGEASLGFGMINSRGGLALVVGHATGSYAVSGENIEGSVVMDGSGTISIIPGAGSVFTSSMSAQSHVGPGVR